LDKRQKKGIDVAHLEKKEKIRKKMEIGNKTSLREERENQKKDGN
jgi:hypothetical protein